MPLSNCAKPGQWKKSNTMIIYQVNTNQMQLYMIPLVSKGTTKHVMNKQHQAPEPRKIIATCPRYMGFQSIQSEQKDINHK